MKKRLLFALMAMCMAVSGFALTQGEFVYTPQGRFQITGDNLNANNAFNDFGGWTVISATEGTTLADRFNINANGYAAGMNSVASLDATAGEGMYFAFTPTSPSDTYVVSYKMKTSSATPTSVRKITTEVSTNLVKVEGNSDNTYAGETNVLVCNAGEELSTEWQTFNYAIVGDGTARTYYISISGMDTAIEFADLQIAPAMQFADLRQRDAMLEKLNAYVNCYPWDAAMLAESGMTEAIENLQAIGDETGQAALNEQLTAANDIVVDFAKENMDDYLAGGDVANYFGIKATSGNTQKAAKIGDWTAFPGSRGFWSYEAYPDFGHFQQGNKWCNGAPDDPMGASLQKDLTAGSYVFAVEATAANREPKKQCWTFDEGMKPAYGVAYVVKINGEQVDTVVSVVKELLPIQYTPFFVTAKITEDGTYEFGIKAYCKETHKALVNGSVVYLKDASIFGKNEAKYSQAELAYETDVREQITTGRSNLTTAAESLANAEKYWGKAELQACVDTIAPQVEKYEAYSQDEIIATFDKDLYVKEHRTANAEEGLLVYEVYVNAVRDILAANRKFAALNDTLESMQPVIDGAEATLNLRVYDKATGKAALQTAIDKAKATQAAMNAAQYSEENAAAIVAANAELNDAVEVFKATVPASEIATLVDINFDAEAVQDPETQLYSISGTAGTMEFSHFSPTAPVGEDAPYEKGFWSNGEQLWKGYLRVGNGDATVSFDPKPAGAADMGTNIIRISFDMYIQGLSNRSLGFYIKDADGNDICAHYRCYYDGSETVNTLGLDGSKIWAKSGGSYNDASPADAENPTATVIEKTHFEVVMDFGAYAMYGTVTSPNGTATSEKKPLVGVIPAQFILRCNYDNKFATRRPWFDNLKIERINAGETTGVQEVKAAKAEAPVKVFENGRVVINGKYAANGAVIK